MMTEHRDGAPPGIDETWRFGVFAVFAAAVAAGGLGAGDEIAFGLLGGLLGYGLAVGVARLWGQRTRPRNNPAWWLLAVVWLALFWFASLEVHGAKGLAIGLVLAFGIGLAARHDLGVAPTLLLAGAVVTSLFRANRLDGGASGVGGSAPALTAADATWIAITVLLGIVAATLEHERLRRRTGPGTPAPWIVVRLAFVSIWTMVVLALREDVQWGRLFVLLGANLEGQGGQMLLIGILLVALVVAALALRPKQERPRGPPGRTG